MMHVYDHNGFFPERVNAKRCIAYGYSAERQQRGHPDIVMSGARSDAVEHGMTDDQGQYSRRDSGSKAEPY